MRRDIDTRFAVVGSGAGGSVVAWHLARHGEPTVVLERGKWVAPDDMTHDERAMIALLYKDAGAQTNTEADMFLLQGNCVGGSTVLTNAVCFRLPPDVRRAFANRGFDLRPDRLAESFERVESVLNVHELEPSLWNRAAHPMVAGMEALGIQPGRFRKAMLHCIGCGYCNVGCRYGRKMDASVTWVPMARDRGAEILPEAEVVRIEHRGGRVTGLACRDLRDGSPFRVRAERYVLAGGAINTPELLLRSGIHRRLAGRRTSFNAGAIMFAEFDEPLFGFDGDQMCVHHLTDRFAIEQIQNPPLSFALTMPGWPEAHRRSMLAYPNMASAGVLVPTAPVGRVFLGLGHRLVRPLFDHADVRFRLPEDDLRSFREGFKTLARIFLAGGARRVVPPIGQYTEIRSERDVDLIDVRMGSQKDVPGFGSSHPQGGCAIGDDERRDVVAPDFRVRGFGNLYVADASLFPHSIRVNPMVSIMAIADYAIRDIGGFEPAATITEGPAWTARQRLAASAH